MGSWELFSKELDTIVNDDIRAFAVVLLNNAPEYFYEVASSSTGKYHPAYTLGKQGLCRHTKAVLRFLNHILTIDQHKNTFTDRQMDCMRVACLYHDGEKHGEGKSSYTVFEHPLLAANTVRGYIGEYLDEKEIEFIASLIETHMGQWTTDKRSKTILPKPTNAAQKLVHLSDYLASRKDIEILFDDFEKAEEPKIDEFVIPFGKHKDRLLVDVAKTETGYLRWLKENTTLRQPMKKFVDELLEG